MEYLLLFLSHSVALLVGMIYIDLRFSAPRIKKLMEQRDAAMEGWKKSLASLMTVQTRTTDIKSPIQVNDL